jgi:hypothetical protein
MANISLSAVKKKECQPWCRRVEVSICFAGARIGLRIAARVDAPVINPHSGTPIPFFQSAHAATPLLVALTAMAISKIKCQQLAHHSLFS